MAPFFLREVRDKLLFMVGEASSEAARVVKAWDEAHQRGLRAISMLGLRRFDAGGWCVVRGQPH